MPWGRDWIPVRLPPFSVLTHLLPVLLCRTPADQRQAARDCLHRLNTSSSLGILQHLHGLTYDESWKSLRLSSHLGELPNYSNHNNIRNDTTPRCSAASPQTRPRR